MNLKEVESVVKEMSEDDKRDLLMGLAEHFDYRVRNKGDEDVTYFLSTGNADWEKDKQRSNE